MDTLGHEEIKELQEHRPIPYGGWKLLAGIIACVSWMLGISLGLAPYLRGQRVDAGIALPFIAIVIPFALSMSYYLEHTDLHHRSIADAWPFGWLRGYWQRNIRSYTAMLWTQDGAMRFKLYADQWDGWTPTANNLLYAMFRLGGWRRDKIWNVVDLTGKIGSIGIGWNIAFVAVDLDHNDVVVQITNHTGDAMRCSLRQAFDLFRAVDELTPKVCLTDLSGAVLGALLGGRPRPVMIADVFTCRERKCAELDQRLTALFDILWEGMRLQPDDRHAWILEAVRTLKTERADLGERLAEISGILWSAAGEPNLQPPWKDQVVPLAHRIIGERDAAVACVKQMAAAFEESDRLHKMIEGLRLYIGILTWLIERDGELVTRDEKEGYAAARVEASGRLAEKQRRDRRRHGRRAASTTDATGKKAQ